ncbi:MAG: FHA domain-containing protein [Myxococcales bacterium]|nr:FHA domain-containing protein [Myxococcales bacterium]
MGELFVSNGICAGTVFTLPPEPLTIGRTPGCQVQIADPWISSVHARIEPRGAQVWVVDLQSSNGTFVDGARIEEAPLSHGRQLRFGRTSAEYRDEKPASLEVLKQAGTLCRPLNELLVAPPAPAPASDTLRGTGAAEALALARRQVAVLNDIGKALVDAAELDACLAKILSTVARAVRAERACLLLMDEHGAWVPRISEPADRPPRLSTALIEAAARSRAGLVTLDAQQDLRFAASRSVIAQGIRSCLCAPIWAENRVLGMLVLDRGMVDAFTADDLELATVVGYQAALAIERARFLDRAREVEAQRKRLLRHFSPDVAGLILSAEQQEADPLEAKVRDDVTVLFSDVKGFTSLTERLEPLELAGLLREYFRSMAEAIFEERGTLDKFIGDGLMAIFGAPVPQSDGAQRAVRCALAMLGRLSALNASLSEDRRFSVRIGINTGWVIAGNVGSPDRLEFTVLGDTVNTAARLESIAEPNCVYVGRTTYELTRHAFDFEPLGTRQVKGKAVAVEVFKARGPLGA